MKWKFLRRQITILFLVLLFFLLGLCFRTVPSYSEICDAANDAAKEQCTLYNVTLVALWHIGKAFNDYSAAIVAIATVFVGYFTFTLKRSTDKLWDAGERQLKLSSDTAQRQLRAYIAITECRYATAGDRWIVCGKFKNVGQTPAFDIRIRGDAFVKEYPLQEFPSLDFSSNDLSKTALFPTEDLPYYEIGEKRPPTPDLSKPPPPNAFTWEKKALWLVVEVRYFDTFGTEHFTRRCLHSGNVIPAIKDFDNFCAHAVGNEAD